MTSLLITGATVFTGEGPIHTRADVIVEDGLIAAVGPDLRAPEGAAVIEADGLFMTPGLIDAHTHLALPDVPERAEPHPDTPFHAARAASLCLSSGVTTVRDVGGNNHADLALSRAIRRGLVPGPHMICCGQAIVPTGGHIHYFCQEADGPEAVRAAARRQMKAGATWIKLMISGGIANVEEHPDEMHYTREEIAAAVEAAAERGAGHILAETAARQAAVVVAEIGRAVALAEAMAAGQTGMIAAGITDRAALAGALHGVIAAEAGIVGGGLGWQPGLPDAALRVGCTGRSGPRPETGFRRMR